jgi:hypothetical protein
VGEAALDTLPPQPLPSATLRTPRTTVVVEQRAAITLQFVGRRAPCLSFGSGTYVRMFQVTGQFNRRIRTIAFISRSLFGHRLRVTP